MFKNANQSGRSMIEMLGVLAIVGILSAGGIAGYSMAMNNHKTNAMMEKVHLIAQRTKELYGSDYRGLNNNGSLDALINAGMLNDKNTPFGGEFQLWQAEAFPNAFTIKSPYNVPQDACVKLLLADWGPEGVFLGMTLNDKYSYESLFAYDRNTYPTTVAKATSACKGGGKRVQWWFK